MSAPALVSHSIIALALFIGATSAHAGPFRKAATAIQPAASAADIVPLATLLDKAGWKPTPELSGIFSPGAVFLPGDTGHSVMVRSCFDTAPFESTYTAAEIVTQLQAGVELRVGMFKVGGGGTIVKKTKFGTPIHTSIERLAMMPSDGCLDMLSRAKADDLEVMYVIQEVLSATITEQTCGRVDANGRFVGLGSAEAELSRACAQESLEPVAVGYRTVPIWELLAEQEEAADDETPPKEPMPPEPAEAETPEPKSRVVVTKVDKPIESLPEPPAPTRVVVSKLPEPPEPEELLLIDEGVLQVQRLGEEPKELAKDPRLAVSENRRLPIKRFEGADHIFASTEGLVQIDTRTGEIATIEPASADIWHVEPLSPSMVYYTVKNKSSKLESHLLHVPTGEILEIPGRVVAVKEMRVAVVEDRAVFALDFSGWTPEMGVPKPMRVWPEDLPAPADVSVALSPDGTRAVTVVAKLGVSQYGRHPPTLALMLSDTTLGEAPGGVAHLLSNQYLGGGRWDAEKGAVFRMFSCTGCGDTGVWTRFIGQRGFRVSLTPDVDQWPEPASVPEVRAAVIDGSLELVGGSKTPITDFEAIPHRTTLTNEQLDSCAKGIPGAMGWRVWPDGEHVLAFKSWIGCAGYETGYPSYEGHTLLAALDGSGQIRLDAGIDAAGIDDEAPDFNIENWVRWDILWSRSGERALLPNGQLLTREGELLDDKITADWVQWR